MPPNDEMPQSSADPPGLYLHVPFCRTKCPYCGFYSTTDTTLISPWLEALAEEISLLRDGEKALKKSGQGPGVRDQGSLWPPHPFDTLYLGGGTPSLLPDRELTAIFDLIQRHFRFTGAAEVTLEANPDDVTPEKLLLWRALGVNRLSLGVQTLSEAELRFLGRRHSAGQAREALATARKAGYDNLGIDLMYALPGQTEAGWLATLDEILAFQPEHLSCYQLSIEAGTPLAKLSACNKMKPVDEDRQRALFLQTSEYLESHGYIHYEISNFARGEAYAARHNSKYWRHTPYLGLGPAAHSFNGRERRWNLAGVKEYCEALAQGGMPVAGREVLTQEQLRLEILCLGFRTRQGVSLQALKPFPQAVRTLAQYCQAGLLVVEQGRARPTRQGFLVADSLSLMLSE